MSQFQIENRYAKAMHNWAFASGNEEKCLADMHAILGVKNKETETFFLHYAKKQSLLLSTIAALVGSLSGETQKFLRFMASKKRLHFIFGIAQQFILIVQEKSGIKTAKLITARQNMGDNFTKSVQSALKKRDGHNYTLQQSCNPKLIGGFLVIIGNTITDHSIAGKLEVLQKTMQKNV